MEYEIVLKELRVIRGEMHQGFRDSNKKFDKGLERVHDRISITERHSKEEFKEISTQVHELDKRTAGIKTKVSLYMSVAVSFVVIFKDKIQSILSN